MTWWDRTGRWDILDPLVIAGAPIWFVALPALAARLVLLGAPAGE